MNLKSHLLERKVNFDIHSPVLDLDNNIATFFLYNLTGQLVGYQQYNPQGDKKAFNDKSNSKYYTYRKTPTVTLFGLESYNKSSSVVFLTEGLFDATRLTFYGQTAFAALTNNPPKDYYNFLRSLSLPVVCVCDNDNSGQKLSKFGDYVEVTNAKDLGDESEEYVRYLMNKYQSI